MSSQSLQDAVARNSNWINSVITNSKLASQLSELLSIDSLNQKINIQEGELDAKFVNAKTLRGYKGTWAADTNTPALSNSSGVVGDIYKVSVGGTIDIGSGSITYVVGDLIYLSEDNWIKISPNQISDIIGLTNILDDTVRKTGDQSIAGEKTFTGDVIATTKPNATNNTTVATTAFVKNLIGEIPAGLAFEGTWNADTNTPDLSTATLSNGKFWIVSVSGATDLGGITDWKVGDWAIYVTDGAGADGWQKVDNSSVLDGQGTGQTVALWSGSGDTNTLTNSPITVSGDDVTFAGLVTMTDRLDLKDSLNNTFIGSDSGISNTTGSYNVASGYNTLYNNTEGDGNIALGRTSLQDNTTGDYNIALGYQSLLQNTTGGYNVALGTLSLRSSNGDNNIALGFQSGRYIADGTTINETGSTSIFIGKDTRANADGENNQIVIGNTAIGNGSNTVTLGNDSIVKTILKGSIGIGTDSPDSLLNLEGFKNTSIITLGSTNNDGGWSVGDKIGAIDFYSYDGSGAGAGLKGSISYENEQGNTAEYLSLVFRTAGTSTGTNNTERMRIDSDGNTAFSGSISTTGTISGVLANGVTATTQTAGDNSTKVATTAYANAAASAIPIGDYLPLAGGTLTGALTGTSATFAGDVTLSSGSLNVIGANSVNTVGRFESGSGSTTSYLQLLPNGATDTNSGYIGYDTSNLLKFYTQNTLALTLDATQNATFAESININSNNTLNLKNVDNTNGFQLYNSGATGATNANLIFLSGAVGERMRIASDGNVGIGTTNPAGYRLAVENTSEDLLKLHNSTDGLDALISFTNPGGTLGRIQGIDNGGLGFDVGDNAGGVISNAMFVKNNGNVGIGTDSPLGKLQVTLPAYTNEDTNSQQAIFGVDSGYGVRVGYNETDNKGYINVLKPAVAWGDLVLQSGGGNVGIGTDSPRYQLDLAKAENSSQADYIALGVNNGNAAGTGTALGSGLIWKANFSGYTKRSAGIVQIAQGSYFRSALAFYTNGTANSTTDWSERMRIDMDGNVGIGTTSPDSLLHIYNPSANWDEEAVITLGTDIEGTNQAQLRYYRGLTDATTESFQLSVSGTTALTALYNGNVGIGTDSPTANLEVNEQTANTAASILIDSASWNAGLTLKNGNGTWEILNDYTGLGTTDALGFYNGGYHMVIDNTGKVGIGTDSPVSLLHIKGADPIFTIQDTSTGTAQASSTLRLGESGSGGVLDVYWDIKQASDAGNTHLEINHSASGNALTILDNKNVGIGTTSPSAKLDVADEDITTASAIKTLVLGSGTSTNGNGQYIQFRSSSNADLGSQIAGTRVAAGASSDLRFSTTSGASVVTERMRITSGGNVLFNTVAVPTASISGLCITGSNNGNISSSGTSTTAYNHWLFYNGNGLIGYISTSGSTTTYYTGSDYRLKEDLQDFNGLDMVSKIPVYDFKWKTDESRSYGVMAHELQEVLPDAVSGEKDAEEMQGVDYSKIVPLLVKSIQELTAKVERLEAK